LLDTASWLPLASGLEVGEKRYVEHECGGGRKLIVSRDTKGYNAWCFRCNEPGWAPAPKLSLAERIAAAKALAEADKQHADATLPTPQVHDLREWPLSSRVWLHKAGLGAPEIRRLGAYYHPPTDRVVLPVLEAGEPVFWQARSTGDRLPKYLSPAVGRDKLLPRFGSGDSITLTEDLLSAFKIGLVAEAWCLMGTYANPRLLAGLLERKAPVNVWTDPDAAGRAAAKKVHSQLKAYGIEARVIRSARDPKLHTFDQIRSYLQCGDSPSSCTSPSVASPSSP
jgi:hypothetical protein